MVFLNLRQQTDSVQALLIATPEKVSKQMIKWAASLADESIVLVEGIARKTQEPIKSASVSDVEVHISQVKFFLKSSRRSLIKINTAIAQIHLISGIDGRLPFTVEDANRPETEGDSSAEVQYKRVLLETRLNNRIIDLRVSRVYYSHGF